MAKPAKIFTFSRVEAYVTPSDETVVEWELNPMFEFLGDREPVFYIEWSRAGGEWSRINTDFAICNACLYLDEDKRRCGYKSDIFYRVVAFDGDREYTSKPANTLGDIPLRDQRLARDIIRKEYLRMVKTSAGSLGHLLKKRWCGKKCTSCVDYDIDEPVSSACSTCYGTGIQKGYYDAIPFWVDLSGGGSNLDVKENFSLEDSQRYTGRCVAYPRLDTYDIWVHGSSNKRFVIRSIQVAASVRFVPLVYYPTEFSLLPRTDIAYTIPLTQSSDDIEPGKADPSSGWRQGISYEDVF